ncbi:MAG: prepilin-type N-terminal cleavage/methylation domain-containing protein [Candidatus Omnitrophica bacterium]|nr:prepilin-type N-terminal cleavage/methylation domain-containing protein [Candidatus Omnitrophota bacterium]
MNKKGLTLAELLVASILISIVMIGVASFSASMQQFQNSTNRTTILAMRTMSVMNQIERDGYLAIGDETNPGVVIGGTANKESICFRHDADGDPMTYDNNWVCYYGRANRELWLCGDNPTVPVDGWNDCQQGNGERVLVDLFSKDIVTGPGPLGVTVTLKTIFDRAQGFHPLKNPRYDLETMIMPPGHSSS